MSSWTIKEGNGTESTAVTNGETLTIAQGSGIQSEMTSTTSGGTITITNTDKGSSQNIFKNVTDGKFTTTANVNNDTLTIVGCKGKYCCCWRCFNYNSYRHKYKQLRNRSITIRRYININKNFRWTD